MKATDSIENRRGRVFTIYMLGIIGLGTLFVGLVPTIGSWAFLLIMGALIWMITTWCVRCSIQ